MMGMMLGWALQAAVQDKPLAGSLPPMPPPRPERSEPRPRGRLFISPMGEPFRGDDAVRLWFDGADTDHDGKLTPAEFVADAARFFAVLDRGHDGEIDPDDVEYYETVLAPEIRTGGDGAAGGGGGGAARGGYGGGRRGGGGGGGGRRGGGGSGGGRPSGGDGSAAQPQHYTEVRRGAARFGFLDYPEPVTAADTNLNRGVDAVEFRAAALDRFALLDRNHDGRITRDELPPLPSAGTTGGWRGRGRGGRPPDRGQGAPPDGPAADQ